MSNRLAWIMGSLAVGGILTAVGVSLNGYRNTPVTPEQRAALVSGPVSPEDTDPMAPRLFDKSGPIRVHVAGAVKKPGVYSLPEWARVVDAMKRAGGPTQQADLDAINLADPVKDGEQVRIPLRGRPQRLTSHQPAPEPGPVQSTVGGNRSGRYPFTLSAEAVSSPVVVRSSSGPAGKTQFPLNLNTATQKQLEELPGIGPSTAEAILAYRRQSGPFTQPEDLLNVRGIGEGRFDQIRSLVTAP